LSPFGLFLVSSARALLVTYVVSKCYDQAYAKALLKSLSQRLLNRAVPMKTHTTAEPKRIKPPAGVKMAASRGLGHRKVSSQMEALTGFGVTAQLSDKNVISIGDKATAILDEIDKQVAAKPKAAPSKTTAPK
jgi:hypothetical protein